MHSKVKCKQTFEALVSAGDFSWMKKIIGLFFPHAMATQIESVFFKTEKRRNDISSI